MRLDPSGRALHDLLEWRFKRALKKQDIAYLWPNVSLSLHQELRTQGITVVREQINTTTPTFTACIKEAYRYLSWQAPAGEVPTQEDMEVERTFLEQCDYIFAPSDRVRESLLGCGIDASRILTSSYGWSEDEVDPKVEWRWQSRPRSKRIYLFTARGCVRKGLPFLLAVWEKARLENAELHIFGKIDEIVQQRCRAQLQLPGIVLRGFVNSLRDAFREADVFMLPSYEEGSPMVSYTAAASGLAMLVSPMGAGGFLRDQLDARIIEATDCDGWVEALRQLHDDESERQRLQQAAASRAVGFHWNDVANRRAAMLIQEVEGRAA